MPNKKLFGNSLLYLPKIIIDQSSDNYFVATLSCVPQLLCAQDSARNRIEIETKLGTRSYKVVVVVRHLIEKEPVQLITVQRH